MIEPEIKNRWDICRKCLGELNGDKVLMEECKIYAWNNRHEKWENPYFGVVMNVYGWAEGSLQLVCPSCKFVLEHGVFDQENLDE